MNADGLAKQLHERLGDVALITNQLAEQLLDQIGNWFAVIYVGWCEEYIEKLTAVIDDQM